MGKLRYYYTSNIGKCRKANQDNFYSNGHFLPSDNQGTDGILKGKALLGDHPIFAVFDGMGGEECGEMAAFLASETMSEFSFGEDMASDLDAFCREANARICAYTREYGITAMGTTAAILRFTPEKAGLCNVGDSRIFLYSDKTLTQLSFDHVGIAVAGRKPPLTQNLGIEETEMVIEPFVALGDYRPGDRFLLCSDGLTDMVTQERIGQLLKRSCRRAAGKLLKEALQNGGKDNVSFILIRIPKKTIFRRMKEVLKCRRK